MHIRIDRGWLSTEFLDRVVVSMHTRDSRKQRMAQMYDHLSDLEGQQQRLMRALQLCAWAKLCHGECKPALLLMLMMMMMVMVMVMMMMMMIMMMLCSCHCDVVGGVVVVPCAFVAALPTAPIARASVHTAVRSRVRRRARSTARLQLRQGRRRPEPEPPGRGAPLPAGGQDGAGVGQLQSILRSLLQLYAAVRLAGVGREDPNPDGERGGRGSGLRQAWGDHHRPSQGQAWDQVQLGARDFRGPGSRCCKDTDSLPFVFAQLL